MLNKSREQGTKGMRERGVLNPKFVQEHIVILSEGRRSGRSRRICGCSFAERIHTAAVAREGIVR